MNGKELQQYQSALAAGSLGSYIHWVNQIPMLSEQEERELAEKLNRNGDLEAARRLVMSHLRLVVKLARGYMGYGLALADLIQEGNIGLMKAVKRFKPDKGARLVTFAIHWIRAEIHEYVIRNWRIVKIATTKAQRKLFFNLRKAAKKLDWFSDSEVAVVASELNVSEKDVRQMEARFANADQSLETPINDNDEEYLAPIHYLEDHQANPEQALLESDNSEQQTQLLSETLKELDPRSVDILKARWLEEDNKATLQDLAAKYNVSAERIRQLEQAAMKKIRGKLLAAN